MSSSQIIVDIKPDADINDYTRLLRDIAANNVVENIDFWVD